MEVFGFEFAALHALGTCRGRDPHRAGGIRLGWRRHVGG